MIVSGLPERNGTLHVKEIAGVALSILQSVLTFEIPHKPDRQLEIRIGIDSSDLYGFQSKVIGGHSGRVDPSGSAFDFRS